MYDGVDGTRTESRAFLELTTAGAVAARRGRHEFSRSVLRFHASGRVV